MDSADSINLSLSLNLFSALSAQAAFLRPALLNGRDFSKSIFPISAGLHHGRFKHPQEG